MKKLLILLGFSSLLMLNALCGFALSADNTGSKDTTSSADELTLSDDDDSSEDDEDE